jgi:hypothetical protein
MHYKHVLPRDAEPAEQAKSGGRERRQALPTCALVFGFIELVGSGSPEV